MAQQQSRTCKGWRVGAGAAGQSNNCKHKQAKSSPTAQAVTGASGADNMVRIVWEQNLKTRRALEHARRLENPNDARRAALSGWIQGTLRTTACTCIYC